MQIIEPTPSQAAVALQRYLKEQGCPLKLGIAQEALARTKGYSSWNALASDLPVRGTKRVKAKPEHKMTEAAQAVEAPKNEPTLQHFIDASDTVRDADPALQDRMADDLRLAFSDALAATLQLGHWCRQCGRDECYVEEDGPHIQVSYDTRLSPRFGTELVFTLRDGKVKCYVRTWEFRDQQEPSSDYRMFDERSGDYDTDCKEPDEDAGISELVTNAVAEATNHIEALRRAVNV